MRTKPVILFGGKGGVGKTTCSAAVAACNASRGRKTIAITSDMTPSLSDVFGAPIGEAVTEIAKNLFAFEISQEAIAYRWKDRFSRDFSDILSQLVDLDALDTESRHHLLDYIGSAPSLREETMLDLIVDTVETGGYDLVVWDTAPAGETLNLLNMPRFIRRHLTAGAKVFEGLDKISKQLTGRRSISKTMDEWIRLSERISVFLREQTAFVVVAKPETLVVRHVERLLKTLRDYDLTLEGMIINCIIGECDSGMMRSLQSVQSGHAADLAALAAGMPVATVPLSLRDIRGVSALAKIGESICDQLQIA